MSQTITASGVAAIASGDGPIPDEQLDAVIAAVEAEAAAENAAQPAAAAAAAPKVAANDDHVQIINVELTRLTKLDGGILSKRITWNAAEGKIVSDGSECALSLGQARRVKVAGPRGLAKLIVDLGKNEAIALGSLRPGLPESIWLGTKDTIPPTTNATPPEWIARTAADIQYRAGQPAYALIDGDFKGMPGNVRARIDELRGVPSDPNKPPVAIPALQQVVPGLLRGARVMRRSTSAGIVNRKTGQRFPYSGGFHLYLLVADGSDIPRFLRAFHDRCWLAGLGWLIVGKGGQLLERSLVDKMVGAAERISFEGPPKVEAPLYQDLAQRQPYWWDGPVLDTLKACPPLTAVEEARVRELKAAERKRLAPEAKKARAAFIEDQVRRVVERNPNTTPLLARRVIERQLDGVLLPDVQLQFDDPGLGVVTVGAVLADPERFVGATLADPLEGIEYGRCKAKIMRRESGDLWINSFAHGRTTYEMKTDAAVVRAVIERTPQREVPTVFAKLALAADLNPVELDELTELAANLAHVGKMAIKKLLREEQAKHEREQQREDPGNQSATAPEDSGMLILSRTAPLVSAKAFVDRRYTLDGDHTLRHQGEAFYKWSGTHYEELPGEEVRAELYAFLATAVSSAPKGNAPPQPFDPDRNAVNDIKDAMAAVTQISGKLRPPSWLRESAGPPTREIIAFKNGLLHLPTRTLLPHTPLFYSWNALPFAYDPGAPEPKEWLKFLRSLWPKPEDQDSIDCLQEIFGLMLTLDTKFQKAFMIIGQKRCGKGTIGRVLRALVGQDNSCGPTLASLTERFGFEQLIGKQVAVIGDARISDKTDSAVIAERILSLTGEDGVTFDRKFRPAWNAPLWVRLLVLSNKLPQIEDSTGVLASRFIILRIIVTFYGREDLGLMERLTAELSGILNWALDGYERLIRRGGFLQPRSGRELADQLTKISSPLAAFLADRCEIGLGKEFSTNCTELFAAWQGWCREQGYRPGSSRSFSHELMQLEPTISIHHPREQDGKQRSHFKGVKLLPLDDGMPAEEAPVPDAAQRPASPDGDDLASLVQ